MLTEGMSNMYDELIIDDFDMESEDGLCVRLEVQVSFDMHTDGIENIEIDNVWDISDDNVRNHKELSLRKDFTSDELKALKGRVEKQLFDNIDKYENDIYLSMADSSYDDWSDGV